MRIQIVLNGLGTGGAERSTAEMIPALERAGARVRVACLYARREGVEQQVRRQGTPVTVLEGGTLARKAIELRGSLRRWAPDVVHTAIFEADLVGRIAAAGAGLPVLTSLVNDSYSRQRLRDDRQQAWKVNVTRFIEASSAHILTAHFHAISGVVKSAAVERLWLPADRITVVPRSRTLDRLGVYSPERRNRVRTALGLGLDQRVVLAIGRHEYQKGLRYLLTAFGRVTAGRSDAILLLAGRRGGETAGLLTRAQRSGIASNTRFLGYREDVGDLLCAADVLAFPSLYEGLGGAALEAALVGTPVVASDVPALRELLDRRDATVFVPPASAEDLARGLEYMLHDPGTARARAQACVGRYVADFAPERVYSAMLRLYERVARATR